MAKGMAARRTFRLAFAATVLAGGWGLPPGAGSAAAGEPEERKVRIRVVDFGRVVDSSEQGREGLAEIDKRYGHREARLKREARDLREEDAKLRAAPLDHKGFAYREAQLKLGLKKLAHEKETGKYLEECTAEQLKLREAVFREVHGAIRAYAEAHGIDIVLQRLSTVPRKDVRSLRTKGVIGEVSESHVALALHVSDAADITAAVIELLNKAHQEGRSLAGEEREEEPGGERPGAQGAPEIGPPEEEEE